MPYERDIRTIRDDIGDEGITSTVLGLTIVVATFATVAALIWFVIATH